MPNEKKVEGEELAKAEEEEAKAKAKAEEEEKKAKAKAEEEEKAKAKAKESPGAEEEFTEVDPLYYQDLQRAHENLPRVEEELRELKQVKGRQDNELGEYHRLHGRLDSQPVQPTVVQPASDIEFSEDDYEDPVKVASTLNKMSRRIKELEGREPGLTQAQMNERMLEERAMEVIESIPQLNSLGVDPDSQKHRGLVQLQAAAVWAGAQNQSLGKVVYTDKDLSKVWTDYKKYLAGDEELQIEDPVSQATKVLVRRVRTAGEPVITGGPGGAADSIVDQYKAIIGKGNQKEAAQFLRKIKDPEILKQCQDAVLLG